MADVINGDLIVNGAITANQINAPIPSLGNLPTQGGSVFTIPLTTLRQSTDFATVLSGTPSGSDLGIITGTFGTTQPYVRTSDAKTTTVTQRCRALVQFPFNYVAGQTAALRAACGMLTTVSDTTATIDMEAYLLDRTTSEATDLVTTSATSINSLTFSNRDFSLTSSSLSPGSLLDVRVTIAITDAATVGSVYGAISALELVCTTRG